MGTQKALLPWDGTTLLAYQLAQLAAVSDVREIIVVTGHDPDRIREIVSVAERARPVHNRDYASGKVGSIQAGLKAISPDANAVMLLAVDQPRPAALLRDLGEAHFAGDRLITIPAHDGRRGHPVIFNAALRGELAEITEETLGVRAVLHRHADEVAAIETADPAALLDLNAPGDIPASLP